MSLSSQYLEELSRRYKKQVEEMQKSFNRTLQAVHDAARLTEEREAQRQEEMQLLQKQLAHLTESVQNIIGERDSWLNKLSVLAQHLILICVEVLVFVLLIYFCRRVPNTTRISVEDAPRKISVGVKGRKGSRTTVKRRKSVEGVSGHESPRTRNRRPSEEALNIAGSYQDLLIKEPGIMETGGLGTLTKTDGRRRRRKKKDVLLRSASIRLPVKSVAPLMDLEEEEKRVPNRRANSLELGVWWQTSNGVPFEEETECVEINGVQELQHQQSSPAPLCSEDNSIPLADCTSPRSSSNSAVSEQQKDSTQRLDSGDTSSVCEPQLKNKSASDTVPPRSQNNGHVKSNVVGNIVQKQLSSPMFMRTATSIRSSRLGSSSVEPSPPAKLKSDNWEWYSTHHGLDKSSQSNKVTCSIGCLGTVPGESSRRQNGHTTPEDTRRSSNASSSASSASNVSDQSTYKDLNKKGPSSSLKKMVKKFF